MGTLRNIGESISQQQTISTKKRKPSVFKINGKYYEEIKGIEITKDEVDGRMVINFEATNMSIKRKARRM